MQLDLGQVDAPPAQVLVRLEAQLLEYGGEARNHHLAVCPLRRRPGGRTRESFERLERDRQLRLRVVVDVDRPDVGALLVPVEPIDVVLARLVQVDGVLVDQRACREKIDLADDHRPRMAQRVDDDHVLRRRDAQRDLRRGEVFACPVPASIVGLADVAFLGEESEQFVGGHAGQRIVGRKGQFEGRGAHVREQHVQVGRIEPCLLRRCLEKVLGVCGHELVDGAGAGNQDRDAGLAAAPGAAHLLPRAGDRARVAGQDRRVEPSDVNAQLERVGRHHPEHFTGAQAGLDRPTFRGQVTAAVAAHAGVRTATLAQRLAQTCQQQLHADPRPTEHDGLPAGAQERQRRRAGEAQGTRSDARSPVERRRVEHHDVLLAGRCAVVVDDRDRPAGERLGQRSWVADGRRAAHDLRAGAVVRAQPQQAAQHVGDVRPEDAAVRMRLVDHDVAQLLEELKPLGVMRQDRRVEHVRVGDHHLAG